MKLRSKVSAIVPVVVLVTHSRAFQHLSRLILAIQRNSLGRSPAPCLQKHWNVRGSLTQ